MRTPKKITVSNNFFILANITLIAALLIIGSFFKLQIENLKKSNLKNLGLLNQVIPGFNSQSAELLKKQTRDLKAQLLGLSAVFDPKYKWMKKDYDLSIYFVEELTNINQLLKEKAQAKQLDFPGIGFKEKLPSPQEASYLLTQLYSLKEALSLGLDYGVSFKSVSPLEVKPAKTQTGVKLLPSYIESICPSKSLVEFIIQLNEVLPRVCIESIALKSQGDSFQMDFTITGISVDVQWDDWSATSPSLEIKEVLPRQLEDFVHTIRSKNPFFVVAVEGAHPDIKEETTDTDKGRELSRFFYRGKAVMKSQEVVVIEDTLNQETVFLAPQEKIGNFILQDYTDEQIVLRSTEDNKELIIKRQE